MPASPPLGLRAQIVLALSLVFLLAVWSLGFVTLQITRRNSEVALARSERSLARSLAPALEGDALGSGAEFQALCDTLQARSALEGMRLVRHDGRAHYCGSIAPSRGTEVSLPHGGHLQLALTPTRDATSEAYVNLLLFYMAITGLAVLLLAYVLLTYLIVRPIGRLTRSVESLASGAEHVSVKEQGSAEATRLAGAFNDMALQLRAKHDQLTSRLAELERTTQDLRHKEQQLIHGEKLASVGRLAAGVAHEIGNPLAAILGLLELLREGDLGAAQSSEFLRRVQRETERIHQIIRDLLDFARLSPEAEQPLETSDLRSVIDDAVNLVKPQKDSKDIAIHVAIDPATSEVLGPRHRLTQITLNLLLNALDALEGKGRIDVRAEPSADGASVSLFVMDTGPGIADEMKDKLFDPFTTTKPAGKGTGLGLAVTHAIVQGLGGTIAVHNREQGGACFEVRLRPRRPSVAAEPARRSGRSAHV
jgi:C4-dicarboxylate-specific signal transduction histidine kinase